MKTFLVVTAVLVGCLPAMAFGQRVSDLGGFVAGVASGFVVHEAGHYAVARMVGAKDISFKFGTFTYQDDLSDANNFRIAAAGFVAQNSLGEIGLTIQEHHQHRSAYVLGVLTWNVLEEATYVLRRHGTNDDLEEMARASDIPKTAMWSLLTAKGIFDIYRWYHPKNRWAPWVSRSGTGILLGATILF